MGTHKATKESRGRSNRLVGQVGEFLVCAELGRRGMIATPFAGNVPSFDVIAVGRDLRSIPIQDKTADGGDWQYDSERFLDIDYDQTTQKQTVRGLKTLPNADLITVFVWLAQKQDQRDRFFVFRQQDWARLVYDRHTKFLEKHGGRRPRKPESMHGAIRTQDLSPYEDKWELIVAHAADGPASAT